jgi:hypothetical protein
VVGIGRKGARFAFAGNIHYRPLAVRKLPRLKPKAVARRPSACLDLLNKATIKRDLQSWPLR